MKSMNFFSLQTDEMTIFEMNAVRGGGGGMTYPVDEDILLRDSDLDDDDDDDDDDQNT